MASKLVLLVALLLALVVIVAESKSSDDFDFSATHTCTGLVGDCIGDEEDTLDSESARRQLRGRRRYISNEVLRRDKVPCDRPGQSYYYCRGNIRANPYRRGCTYITHCARDLS